MHELYDLGYMDIRKIEPLKRFIELTGSLIVDARFAPFSRNPTWTKGNLQKELGEHYVHVKALGNKNYKGGDVDFLNLDSGLAYVAERLEDQPVIVMCGCWDRNRCHRYLAVTIFADRYGFSSIGLTLKLIQDTIEASDPKQLGLF